MKSADEVPERILVTGMEGAGKSEVWVQVARQLRLADSGAKVYVANCETVGTVERCNSRYSDWRDNIVYENVRDWRSLTPTTSLYAQLAKPDDWLVIDAWDSPWGWVRNAYVEQRERQAGRLPNFEDDPFAVLQDEISGPDYNQKINPAFDRWWKPLLNDLPCHLLVVAPAQPIKVKRGEKDWGDDEQMVREYGHYGVRPSGQKSLVFQMHTKLLVKHKVVNSDQHIYTMTSMGKDRGRPLIDDVQLPDEGGFPLVYLAGCAGWQL